MSSVHAEALSADILPLLLTMLTAMRCSLAMAASRILSTPLPNPPAQRAAFEPSNRDCNHVASLLLRFLPSELALVVLDHAEYWCSESWERCSDDVDQKEPSISALASHSNGSNAEVLFLMSGKVGVASWNQGIIPKPRMVRFTMSSSDQGWGGTHLHKGVHFMIHKCLLHF